MCGIAGIAAFRGASAPTEDLLRAMCATIIYRGPDDEGIQVTDGVGLGMRRLSIIDLAGGHQPIANEDGSVRTVFNGEIYNYRELQQSLRTRGHTFRTQSDTEVLVHGYEELGADLPRQLNGMFAFAIHDRNRRKVLLARDHLGIKPLYYAVTREHLVFGSEIKALLASKLIERSLDMDALAELLTWEYVPAPHTLLRGVKKLPPGWLLDVDLDSGEVRSQEYWDTPSLDPGARRSEPEWEEAVDALARKAVQRQLVSDVPLGAFLSGGVDSSLVVSGMGKARTFSISFQDASYDEARWARRVADHLGVDHRQEQIEPSILELFPTLMHHLDDPIGDFSIFPTYMVSRLAREDVTVALSGDGGDEVFGGYETYVAEKRAQAYDRAPGWLRRGIISPLTSALPPQPEKKGLINKLKRFVEGSEHPVSLHHARWRLFLSAAQRETLLRPDARRVLSRDPNEHIARAFQRARARGYGPVTAGLYVDLKTYLAENILTKVDRMSMAVSLETRVPLLDRELVELAFLMPDSAKVRGGHTKPLLKRVAARHVPRECVYRPKEGFSIPIKAWLSSQLRPLVDDLLAAERLDRQGIFDAASVERFVREHTTGAANHSHILWTLMVFQAWHREWLEV